jgi:hypothetical protein
LQLVCNGVVALGPPAPVLGGAANYTILAESGVSTVPTSAITGAVGVSPISDSGLTGWSQTLDSSGTFSTSTQVTGKLYAANYANPTPLQLATAVLNMQAAYTDAAGRTPPDHLNPTTGTLCGLILQPGLYRWTTGLTMTCGLTFNGSSTDTWIIQTTGTLAVSSSQIMTLTGGAVAENIYWAVASTMTFGASSQIKGILLGKTSATFQTGSSHKGRILVQTAVALQSTTVVP